MGGAIEKTTFGIVLNGACPVRLVLNRQVFLKISDLKLSTWNELSYYILSKLWLGDIFSVSLSSVWNQNYNLQYDWMSNPNWS